MLREAPRADRPAPAPLQVPAVQKPDPPTTTAGPATTPQGMAAQRNGPGEFGAEPLDVRQLSEPNSLKGIRLDAFRAS
jgi:hypothetical protein